MTAASPKARECALLLRSASSLSVLSTNPCPQGTMNPGGVNSHSSAACLDTQHGSAPSLDTIIAPLRPERVASLPAVLDFQRGRDDGFIRIVQSIGPIAEGSVLDDSAHGVGSSEVMLLGATGPPFSGQSQGQTSTEASKSVHTKSGLTNFHTKLLTSRDQDPSSHSSSHSLLSQNGDSPSKKASPKPPTSNPSPKPSLPPPNTEVSTTGLSKPRPIFQGPPGFPGRDRIAAAPSSALPFPSDEYGDSQPKTASTGSKKKPVQEVIRGVNIDAATRSRLHLSSSANELREANPGGRAFDTESTHSGGPSQSGKEADETEAEKTDLRRSSSLPQVYRDRYLVPNDEELEYEREEAGIGKNSPRPSAGNFVTSKADVYLAKLQSLGALSAAEPGCI